jgi:hypothetical protein
MRWFWAKVILVLGVVGALLARVFVMGRNKEKIRQIKKRIGQVDKDVEKAAERLETAEEAHRQAILAEAALEERHEAEKRASGDRSGRQRMDDEFSRD